ncbi:MAG: DUF6252 family protein [Bacteroidota bacterium]
MSGFTSQGSNIVQANYRDWKENATTTIGLQTPPPLVEDSTYQFAASQSALNNVAYIFGSKSFPATALTSGSITLTCWDREARIISGTFEFTVANAGDTVRITDGRFDISEVNL